MSDKKYEIIIKADGSGTKNKTSKASENIKDDGTSMPSQFAKAAKSFGVLAVGKQALTFATSRVGVETGDRQLQDNINAIESFVTKEIAIGGAFLLNPALGIAAVASETFSVLAKAHTFNYERNMENIALQEFRKRGGISLNRSRREFQ
ncbi:MAG: hypothetical protein RR348_04205 [Clostridia bacterium]